MKKIVIFLALFVLVYIGGSYYLGNSLTKQYEEKFPRNFPSQVIIEHSYEKGIFRTKITSNVTFKKDDLANFLKIPIEDVKEDLKFEYITNFSHPFFSIISGTKGEGAINLISYKDIVSKIFKDGEVAKYTFNVSNKGEGDIKITINEIYYNDDIGMVKFSPIIIDAKYVNGGFTAINSKEDTINIKLHTGDFDLILDDIKYNVTYDEPFNVDYNDLYKFVSSSSESSFKNLIIKISKPGNTIGLEIPNFKDNSKINVNNGAIDITSISSADKMIINFDKDTFKFSDIKSDISFKNLSEEFYKVIFNMVEKYTAPKMSDQDAEKLVKLFIEKDPSLEFKNLSFKYDDKYNFALNFKTGVKKFDLSNPMEALQNIYLDGKTNFSKGIVDILLGAEDAETKEMLVNSQIIQENGDNYEVSFKYDKDQMDVIINDKIGINQFLSTQY